MSPKRFASFQDAIARARVLIVGDVMLDRYWFGEVERISPEAPVPVVKIARTEERPGGAANVARNAAALGAQTSLLSVVGDDEPGKALARLLASDRVKTSLLRDATLPTTVKLRVIGRQQQLLRIDFETPPSHEVLAAKLADYDRLVPDADLVILSDYGKGGLAHIPEMIRQARAAGRPVLIDPKGSDYERYRGATAITPNLAELAQVIGTWSSEAQLRERVHALLAALDVAAIVLTRSEDGMSLFDAEGQLDLPAEAREVFDVTGAGDTVIATLAAMLAAGLDLRAALPLANRAGGIVVGKFGTATVSYDELFAARSAS